MRTRRSATTTLFALVVSIASTAAAQDESAIAAARALGQEGVVAAREGRCGEAVDKLGRAKQLYRAPTILVPLGECQLALGKIVAGTENLQLVARETLAADAPDKFVDAQKRARKLLPDALKKLGRLHLVIDAPPSAELVVTDNGDPVPSVLIGVDRPADPGKHLIEVSAPGFLKGKAEVTLAAGKSERLTIKLEPDPTPPPATQEPNAPTEVGTHPGPGSPPFVARERGTSPLVVGGAVSLGVGGVGRLRGAVFGGLTLSKQSDLDAICTNKLCPPGSEEDIDAMHRFGDVSTASFVIGGVGAVLGATLIGIGATRSDDDPTAGFEVRVGPAFMSLKGVFP
ncbi:MAG: hypothetical protein HOW73_19855 [Polyangiaceae bacterium]|nr:hypothetical protein [Polyangiaceae bacterium]